MKISIVIPCYNEERTVGLVIERLLKVPFSGWDSEIIVVNDGSSDGTASVLSNYSSRVKVINLAKNSGKGSAVHAGIGEASGDYAVIQDADLECRPEDIPKLLNTLLGFPREEKIAVMGSRELGKKTTKSEFFSRFGSLSITKLINLLYGSSLTDTLMCYKLFPKAVFGYFGEGGFEAEMIFIARLLKDGYRIVEVPVSYDPRDKSAGKKIRYRHGIKIILRILKFWLTGK